MVEQITTANSGNERLQNTQAKELARLRQSGVLEQRLNEIDRTKAFRRIYVMGCGRSGTWLLTSLMRTFNETEVVMKELPVEYFGLLATASPVLVLKRDAAAYKRIDEVPAAITILYMLRHPFDVLTSKLPIGARPYHISPERWRGEMAALRQIIDGKRAATKIIRYEDLVTKPVETQSDLARSLNLSIGTSIDHFRTLSNNPTEAPEHTGRPRKIDVNCIGKHKFDAQKMEYLSLVRPGIADMLDWVATVFQYDVSL
jgi:hypothetical protein